MRFHQFQIVRGGMVAIDLDAVWGVCPLGGHETTVYAGGGCFPVKGAVEDVLALISPPAAPDTFEEELAEQKGAIAEMLSDGERRIRLDELERIREGERQARFDAAIGKARPNWLDQHITRRRTEIEQGDAGEATTMRRAIRNAITDELLKLDAWNTHRPGGRDAQLAAYISERVAKA